MQFFQRQNNKCYNKMFGFKLNNEQIKVLLFLATLGLEIICMYCLGFLVHYF